MKIKFNGLIISFVVFVTIIMTLYSAICYQVIGNLLFSSQSDRLISAAKLAAEQTDPELLESLQIGDNNSEAYYAEKEKLTKIKDVTNLKYIYSMRYYDKNNVEFVVDTDDSSGHEDIGNMYEIYDTIQHELDTEDVAVDSDIMHENGEYLLSGFAPVFNSKGDMVGFIGADVNVDLMVDQREQYLSLFVVIGLIGISVAMLVGYVSTISEKKKINKLFLEANEKQ